MKHVVRMIGCVASWPRTRSRVALLMLVSLCGMAAPAAADTLQIASGNDQSAPAGTQLPAPLVVQLKDGNRLVSGVVVTFAVTAGGGQVSQASVTTDSSGLASTRLTLGPKAGANQVQATAPTANQTRLFNATGTTPTTTPPPAAATAIVLSPASATVTAGSGAAFQARVVDASGTTVTTYASPVTFASPDLPGSFAPGAAVTPTSGVASVTFTPSAYGTGTLTATASGLTPGSASVTATAPPGPAPGGQTLFTTQVPALSDVTDNQPYELGVKFRAAKAGRISALRFWKAPKDTGAHVGTLWSASGTVLARVTFSGETASGWQQQSLPTPVDIAANTTYVASVTTQGYFAVTQDALATSVANGDLATVADGANGVFGAPGALPASSVNNSNYFRDVVYTATETAPPPPPPADAQTLFGAQAPALPNTNDGVPYEMGVKFRAARAGQVTALRFWKGTNDTGTHVGRLWSASGALLAQVTFTGETASGWQQQSLPAPVNIAADTTYVASVNTSGWFGVTQYALGSSVASGDLSTVADGANGVFGSPGAFPARSYASSNYFRDVVFVPSSTQSPKLAKISGDNQTGAPGTTLPLPLVVKATDGSGAALSGVNVAFAITTGSGMLSTASAPTDANGTASVSVTLGSSYGTVQVTASASGIGSVTFAAVAGNPVYAENRKAGTPDFLSTLNTRYTSTAIAGYADRQSVDRGGSIAFKVSVAQPGPYAIDVYRLGYYGGTGGRRVAGSATLSGVTQACAVTDRTTRLVECRWPTTYTLNVGADWTSGVYVAIATEAAGGRQHPIFFIVRDDASRSEILFQSSRSTALAYNNYGTPTEQYSLYDYNSTNGTRALKVSLDRPSKELEDYSGLLRYEFNMLYWLESQGYDVTYTTNFDVHSGASVLGQHRAFLSVGHDEYWSLEMRNRIEQARDSGVNLAFFSANTAYWRVRLEPSSGGAADRVMACYKDPAATPDPVAPTYRWRDPQVNRPENALLGVMYIGDHGDLYGGFDFVVANDTDPYYANTGLRNGATLTKLVGYEWDAVVDNGHTPPGLVVLGRSPVVATATPEGTPSTPNQVSHAVRYRAASGAEVYSTGSIQWMWGLDSTFVNPGRVDGRAQQMAVNVLAKMGARPATPGSNIIVPP